MRSPISRDREKRACRRLTEMMGTAKAPISAGSWSWRRLRRRPSPPSLPRRGERFDSRELAEGRDGGEEECDFSRVVPQVNGSQTGRMGWAVEEMDDGVRAGLAVWTEVTVDFANTKLKVLEFRTKPGPQLCQHGAGRARERRF